MKCRHCHHSLHLTLMDFGSMPPSNAYLSSDAHFDKEKCYPLNVKVCEQCWLVQTQDFTRADELFTADYAYFSSTSSSWLQHAAEYVEGAVETLALDHSSFVVELASNDGYLLQNFQKRGIPNLGVEPTLAAAEKARTLGIDVVSSFFGMPLAKELVRLYRKADLIIANNVLAHVPDINDFVEGISVLLADNGVCSFEFPHLLKLLEEHQFDTIYHEHYSYLSLLAVKRILLQANLLIYRVEELTTHGGSLRVWAAKANTDRNIDKSVDDILAQEIEAGLATKEVYQHFADEAQRISVSLKNYLQEQKRLGRCVVAYGAAAKGNTMLNYAGIGLDLLPVVFDAAPSKQGKFMPGSHIPIKHPKELTTYKPDCVLILPWNLSKEIKAQLTPIVGDDCDFVIAIPTLKQL